MRSSSSCGPWPRPDDFAASRVALSSDPRGFPLPGNASLAPATRAGRRGHAVSGRTTIHRDRGAQRVRPRGPGEQEDTSREQRRRRPPRHPETLTFSSLREPRICLEVGACVHRAGLTRRWCGDRRANRAAPGLVRGVLTAGGVDPERARTQDGYIAPLIEWTARTAGATGTTTSNEGRPALQRESGAKDRPRGLVEDLPARPRSGRGR